MPDESRADGASEAASPFPPAFRWETSTQEAPTQVMGDVGRDTARREPAEQPPIDLSPPVGNPLDRLSESSAPPWASSEPPPIAEQQSDWLRMGPERFQSQAAPSRSKQVIGIAVLALVVLGLAAAAVMHSLAGGSPNRTSNDQITVSPTTAPSAQSVLPTVPAAPPPTAEAPVTTPAEPPAAPTPARPTAEASGSPEAPAPPAAPPPAELAPSPPLHRSTGSSQHRAAAVPAPHNTGSPTSAAPPPPAPAPADTSAPEGFTRVPAQPWHPQAPQ